MNDPYTEGYAACQGGYGFLNNPYEYSSPEGRRWIDGMVKAIADCPGYSAARLADGFVSGSDEVVAEFGTSNEKGP